ncbi:MAG: hypothetical protein J5663_07420 [Bacteroidaceae bacterium]|nr:hypothetical protein [Bacteroidaceae bacterium]
MQEKWNQFVYYLCESKKNGVNESDYHSTIEAQLQLLGWMSYKNEICHKPNLPIGNNGYIQPDIIIQKDDVKQFVIEVKQPRHIQIDKDRDQLVSYMRQLKLNVGIYIGEHIEIFYDLPESENAVSVLIVPLELDNKQGERFIELFSKDNFSKESIAKFCEERINELRHEENLNKVKSLLISDAQEQISKGMKMYLKETYGNLFSESDIDEILDSLVFSTKIQGEPESVIIDAPQPIIHRLNNNVDNQQRTYDSTQYSINGSDFLNKRRFVHKVVKTYVEQHPTATFLELEKIFHPKLQGSLGVIRATKNISEKEYVRYLMSNKDLMQSADGTIFAVCSQWGIFNIPRIVQLATQLGYEIKTKKPQ